MSQLRPRPHAPPNLPTQPQDAPIIVTAKRPKDSDDGACITSYDVALLDLSTGARLGSVEIPTGHPLEDATALELPRGSEAAALLASGRLLTLEVTPRSDGLRGAPLRLERVKFASGAGGGNGGGWLCSGESEVRPRDVAISVIDGTRLGFSWAWPQGDEDELPACVTRVTASVIDADTGQPAPECAASPLAQAASGRPAAGERAGGSCTGVVWTLPAVEATEAACTVDALLPKVAAAGSSSDGGSGGGGLSAMLPAASIMQLPGGGTIQVFAGAAPAPPGAAAPAQTGSNASGGAAARSERRLKLRVDAFDGGSKVGGGESDAIRLARRPSGGAAACADGVAPGQVEILKVARPPLAGPKLVVSAGP